jgi:hypothetical protein
VQATGPKERRLYASPHRAHLKTHRHLSRRRILGLDREALPQEIPHGTLLEWLIRAGRSSDRKVLN